MIACTSPAGTSSVTPFRIGLSATVAWRFSILSICLPLPLNGRGLRLDILYPSAKFADQLIKFQRPTAALNRRADLLHENPVRTIAGQIGALVDLMNFDVFVDRAGEFEFEAPPRIVDVVDRAS